MNVFQLYMILAVCRVFDGDLPWVTQLPMGDPFGRPMGAGYPPTS